MTPAEHEAKYRRHFEWMLARDRRPYAHPCHTVATGKDAERATLEKMVAEGFVVRVLQRVDKNRQPNPRGKAWREVWVLKRRADALVRAGIVSLPSRGKA